MQERLEGHRREERRRASLAAQKEALRGSLCDAIKQRLAGCVTLPEVLRRLRQPLDGEPRPTQAQFLK